MQQFVLSKIEFIPQKNVFMYLRIHSANSTYQDLNKKIKIAKRLLEDNLREKK